MNLDRQSLHGLRVSITGGGTELERQMALELAEAGADLILCASRRKPLEKLAEKVRGLGISARFLAFYATNKDDFKALYANAGRISILVNNADSGKVQTCLDVAPENWRCSTAVNMGAPFRTFPPTAPPMIERRWRRIVNVSSISGVVVVDCLRHSGVHWDNAPLFAAALSLE